MKNRSKTNALALQEQYKRDAKELTFGELARKYKLTYDSWRSVKQRAKRDGIPLDPRFHSFASLLYHMGLRTAKEFTLDRIDTGPNEPYSPENCRWADKRTQTLNRSNSVRLTYKGETLPLVAWAERLGIPANVLYKRRQQKWTDTEIIEGKRSSQHGSRNTGLPWPEGKERVWEMAFIKEGQAGESREEFYLRKATALFEQADARAREYWDRDDPEPRELEEQIKKLRKCMQDAEEKVRERRRRDRYLERPVPGMNYGDKLKSLALAYGKHVLPSEGDPPEDPDDEEDFDDGYED